MIALPQLLSRNLFALSIATILLSLLAESSLAQTGYQPLPTLASNQEASIDWLSNPNLALSYARESGRPILAYVTAKHCGYCRKMERESWSHPAIAKAIAEGYIPLRLDAKQHAAQVRALRVRAYPTTLLLSANGQIATGSAGFLSPAKLSKLLANGTEVAALPVNDASVASR